MNEEDFLIPENMDKGRTTFTTFHPAYLYYIAADNSIDKLLQYINDGVYINQPSSYGKNFSMYCAIFNRIEMIKILIEHKIDIKNYNLLELACKKGHYEMIKLLVDNGIYK